MSQTRVVRGVATKIEHDEQGTHVRYHSTRVVTIHSDRSVTLRTGGYRTRTTKVRMNQAANQFKLGFRVHQKAFDWFVSVRGKEVPFDGNEITLTRKQLQGLACECCDSGCPTHKGESDCSHRASTTLFRIDMDDRAGVAFCDACANDAMDSGVFTTEAL